MERTGTNRQLANVAALSNNLDMTRQDKQIVIAIGVVAITFLIVWVYAPSPFSDFGLNGFTGTLGIAFTVLLIDRLIKRREANRTLLQRLAAFEDVRLLAQQRITFWFQAYMLSVPDPLPKTVQELFSPACIARIGALLDLDSNANVTPRRTWWQHAPEELRLFQDQANRILERYSAILDPEAFLTIHKTLNATVEPGLMAGILQSDREMGFPRVRVLGNYFLVHPTHFLALLELINWLIAERARLSSESGLELGQISQILEGNRQAGTPRCMISSDKLAAQVQTLREFRENPVS